ncbi:MAG TPA: mercury resistance system transport protein MerF [Alphaproteobacteria bacterium]|nr:mercury resistance system transport protein MerF [Alphaproteobacteria bacterium]
MKNNKLLGIGIGGAVLAAVCCFTPLLVVVLSSLGLVAWVTSSWLDFVLLGSLCVFVAITGYALIQRARNRNASGSTGA